MCRFFEWIVWNLFNIYHWSNEDKITFCTFTVAGHRTMYWWANYQSTYPNMTSTLFSPQPLPSLGQRGVLSLHQHLHCRLPSTPLSVVMLDCYCNSKARMVGIDVMDPMDQPDPRDQLYENTEENSNGVPPVLSLMYHERLWNHLKRYKWVWQSFEDILYLSKSASVLVCVNCHLNFKYGQYKTDYEQHGMTEGVDSITYAAA